MKTLWAKFLYFVRYTTSQMGCFIKLFSKSRDTNGSEELEYRTVANRSCSSLVCLKLLPNSEVRIVRGGNCYLHYMSALTTLFVSVLTVLGVIEAQYWFAPSFNFSELFRRVFEF